MSWLPPREVAVVSESWKVNSSLQNTPPDQCTQPGLRRQAALRAGVRGLAGWAGCDLGLGLLGPLIHSMSSLESAAITQVTFLPRKP
jgi:hypothetical protein